MRHQDLVDGALDCAMSVPDEAHGLLAICDELDACKEMSRKRQGRGKRELKMMQHRQEGNLFLQAWCWMTQKGFDVVQQCLGAQVASNSTDRCQVLAQKTC